MLLKFRDLVMVQPIETAFSLAKILGIASGAVSKEIARCHVTAALGGVFGRHTHDRAEVDRALANELQEQSFSEQCAEGEGPKPGGQAVEWFITPVLPVFHPSLDAVKAGLHQSLRFDVVCHGLSAD
jgi:hypothetical protein